MYSLERLKPSRDGTAILQALCFCFNWPCAIKHLRLVYSLMHTLQRQKPFSWRESFTETDRQKGEGKGRESQERDQPHVYNKTRKCIFRQVHSASSDSKLSTHSQQAGPTSKLNKQAKAHQTSLLTTKAISLHV